VISPSFTNASPSFISLLKHSPVQERTRNPSPVTVDLARAAGALVPGIAETAAGIWVQ